MAAKGPVRIVGPAAPAAPVAHPAPLGKQPAQTLVGHAAAAMTTSLGAVSGVNPVVKANPRLPPKPPKYILDVHAWEIRLWSDVQNEPELLQQGYGIISYAWGKWHNKSKKVLPGTPGYPTFRIGNDKNKKPLNWVFPVINKITNGDAFPAIFSNDEQLSIQQFKTAVSALGKRYVWWDWCCIPQGWTEDHNVIDPNTQKRKQTPDCAVHPELSKINGEEVDKMRYLYPFASRGFLWWHQTNWGHNNPVEEVFQTIEDINLMPSAQRDAEYKTLAKIDAFAEQLARARASEQSLMSLWSFQEAVLYASSQRPHDAPNAAVDAILSMPSIIFDVNGLELHPQKALDHGHDPQQAFRWGRADLVDLTTTTSLFAIGLAGALLDLGRSDEEKGKITDENVKPFKIESADETNARGILSRLVNTGLVTMVYDNPLPLLEARFGRRFEVWNSSADICVRTLLGPLGIEMAPELEAIDPAGEAELARLEQGLIADMATTARADPFKKEFTLMSKQEKADVEKKVRSDNSKKVSDFKLDRMKLQFTAKIVEMYQWRMLLLARGGTRDRANALADKFWASLVGRDRPCFASLEVYLGSDEHLSKVYGPFKSLPETLPKLSLDPQTKQLVVAAHNSWAFHQIPAATPASNNPYWSHATVYDYVAPHAKAQSGPSVAGTVMAKQVKYEERHATFGNGTVVLLPIEDTITATRTTRKRCAILVEYTVTTNVASGVFWGIGDFAGLPALTPGKTSSIHVF